VHVAEEIFLTNDCGMKSILVKFDGMQLLAGVLPHHSGHRGTRVIEEIPTIQLQWRATALAHTSPDGGSHCCHEGARA
jgi:hypothetical protein